MRMIDVNIRNNNSTINLAAENGTKNISASLPTTANLSI